jgi:chitinase
MYIKFQIILLIALFSNFTFAEDCANLEQYSSLSHYYEYDLVERNGKVYECKVAGWCQQGGAYTPGAGWAWYQAWSELGSCYQSSYLSSTTYEEFYSGQHYAVGDTVYHQGYLYECRIAGWCSSPAAAYEPGEGTAWHEAWNPIAWHRD